MDKKPKLFVNKIEKPLNNNERVYYSSNDKKEVVNTSRNNDLNQTLN